VKKQKILLIDNYDSFTYNLQHYITELSGGNCDVVRNDAVTAEQVKPYDALIFSPGPGLPGETGLMMDLIKKFFREKKILGVCLGHQALAVATGAALKQLDHVMHGVQRNCFIVKDHPLLKNIPATFGAGRYHSWVVNAKTLSPEWDVVALDDDKEIMMMHHSRYNLTGMQFHPESIMTDYGKQLLLNWLEL
jgi:anthranilate synthase component 2